MLNQVNKVDQFCCTDFDVFLDEVLGIQDLYGSNRSPYEFWQSQPNYLLYGQPNGCIDSQTNTPINSHDSFYNSSTTVPVQDEPSDPLQSQQDPPNSLFHSQPNSPYQSQTNSPSYSQPNSPMENLSSPSHVNPAQSLFKSQSNSPYQNTRGFWITDGAADDKHRRHWIRSRWMIVLRRFLFAVNVILNLILINVSKVMAKSAKEKKNVLVIFLFSFFSIPGW